MARPLPGQLQTQRRDVFGTLSLPVGVTWETGAYATLIVLAFGFRFWDLGARALHHDESLHAYLAYQLLQGGGYEHSPLFHGPFQFFGTAATFFFTGAATDYTARVLPALFGGAMVVLPIFFRGQLGRTGALLTAALIAISPALLYYSRFAREDIYVAVFTLGIIICVWRYIEERRPHYLYILAALLALSFATKETTFVFVATVLLFLNLWTAADLAEQSSGKQGGGAREGLYFLAYLPFAWAMVALWPLLGGLRRRLRLERRHPAMDVLVVLGTLAGPQFAAAVTLPLEAAGVEIASTADERSVAVPTVAALIAASAVIGLLWGRRTWLTAAACFYVPYALLFTAFLTDIEGFGGGIWESLDYWLDQHGERRADQPEFYYLMFLPAYEYLALAFAGPALLYFSLRGGPRSWLFTAITVVALLFFFGADSFADSQAVEIAQGIMLPVAAVGLFFGVRGTAFERFLLFWAAATLVAFTYAGEKMPWLSVHAALPFLVLAGYAGGRVFSVLLEGRPAGDGARPRPKLNRQLPGIAVAIPIVVLAGFSLRTAVLATYEHGDVPREFLFFTQTSPDVPDVMAGIEHIAESSGKGTSLRVQVDEEHRWPWAWYLRKYNVSFHAMGAGFVPDTEAVLLMAAQNETFTTAYRDRYHLPRRYTLRWWFPEDYRGIGEKEHLGEAIGDFAKDLGEADTWERWWGFWFHRDITPRGGIEGRVFVPLAFEAIEFEASVEGDEPASRAPADLEGRRIIGQLGVGPGQMQLPLGVALDGAGNILVVDSGNSRIQKFDSRGTLLAVAGSPGSGPGQFQQPSDIAVDGAGNVFVVDTWNNRIQRFAPDLTPAGGWGQGTRNLMNPGPTELWGPRGIAVHHDGTLLVADTGTHRIRRYGVDGQHFGNLGQRGKEPGEFEEPTGIAVGADGAIYVADAGNARIQKFDAGFKFVASWAVEEWADKHPRNKPQLEALPDGRVIATDPAHSRLILFSNVGTVTARLDTVLDVPLFSPTGVAFDSTGGYVYVTDGLAGHARRFPFTDFALR